MDFTRQRAVFNPDIVAGTPLHIIGTGAVGSAAALQAPKIGFQEIHLWDHDEVASHNISNQWLLPVDADKGVPKVESVAKAMKFLTGIEPILHNERVGANHTFEGIVFLMTDTIDSRKEIWYGALRYRTSIQCVVETRMGVDQGRVYVLNPSKPSHVSEWEESLPEDGTAITSACGGKITVGPVANLIASIAMLQLMAFLTREADEIKGEMIFATSPLDVLVSRVFEI